nr:hypothetical protein [Tanacetum cinerariifolium]
RSDKLGVPGKNGLDLIGGAIPGLDLIGGAIPGLDLIGGAIPD